MDFSEMPNVELISWLGLDEWNQLHREPVTQNIYSFAELAAAIDDRGPIEFCTDRVNVVLVRTSGRFERGIVALRQSGLNVRRIFITPDTFESLYGDVASLVSHIMSNNAIGPEVELAHVEDFAKAKDLCPDAPDETRRYERDDIDAIACLQMVEIMEEAAREYPEDEDFIRFLFSAGFTAGRNFSSLQSAVTLEAGARNAMDAKRKNREKGRKSGSRERRQNRLQAMMAEVERVHRENPALKNQEDIVLRLAFDAVLPKGAYGRGRFEDYCTALRSEAPFKQRYDALFRKSVK